MKTGPAKSIFVIENLTRQCVVAKRVRSTSNGAERRRGLLAEQTLDSDCGLWINPCEAVHTFRMRFDLDVLFLDRSFRVKKISAGMKPNRIALCLTAKSVLELCAGAAAASGTKCGDQLVLRHEDLTYRGL